jgi:hypothetical protein
MRALLIHWPHIVPVLLGFGAVVYLWVANRRWRAEQPSPRAGHRVERGAEPAGVGALPSSAAQVSAAARATRRLPQLRLGALAPGGMARCLFRPRSGVAVRREAARRGAIVLGPMLAAIATGAVIYGVDIAAVRPGHGLIWAHVGFSLLVCLLALYKLAEVEPAQIRRGWRMGRVLETVGSVLLGALLVPLLLSGIVLLASPSSVSYFAYTHLIASAWWTLLVMWHLTRYLKRSMRALRLSRGRRTPPYRSLPAGLRSDWTEPPAPPRHRHRDSRPQA